jgi:hypothetical protein
LKENKYIVFRLQNGGFTRGGETPMAVPGVQEINPRRMQRYGRAPDVNRGNHLLSAGAAAGRRESPFTYFFYVPEHPNVVVVDLDKPLDKQT